MNQDDAVSVVVRRRIHPERQDEFEKWLAGIIEAASKFEGHQGAQVLRPPHPETQDYVLLFRFATPAQLAAWRGSETAKDWLARGEVFTRALHIEQLSGLEFWFRVPSSAGRRPPPKYKMVVATVLGLYPLILYVAPILASNLQMFSRPLATLVSTLCMVLLMTYAVMPLVTRTLSPWLFSSVDAAVKMK
ncbi:MAG: antibiotic biosynthesis monooxygenase [Myxococcota bacterium]